MEHQKDMNKYLSDLNKWFERDIKDRQTEFSNVNSKIDALRHDLANRIGFGQGTRKIFIDYTNISNKGV